MISITIIEKVNIKDSIIKDTYTFGCLIGCIIFNYYLGDSYFFKLILVFMFVFWILAVILKDFDNKNNFKTKKEAIEFLKNE